MTGRTLRGDRTAINSSSPPDRAHHHLDRESIRSRSRTCAGSPTPSTVERRCPVWAAPRQQWGATTHLVRPTSPFCTTPAQRDPHRRGRDPSSCGNLQETRPRRIKAVDPGGQGGGELDRTLGSGTSAHQGEDPTGGEVAPPRPPDRLARRRIVWPHMRSRDKVCP